MFNLTHGSSYAWVLEEQEEQEEHWVQARELLGRVHRPLGWVAVQEVLEALWPLAQQVVVVYWAVEREELGFAQVLKVEVVAPQVHRGQDQGLLRFH